MSRNVAKEDKTWCPNSLEELVLIKKKTCRWILSPTEACWEVGPAARLVEESRELAAAWGRTRQPTSAASGRARVQKGARAGVARRKMASSSSPCALSWFTTSEYVTRVQVHVQISLKWYGGGQGYLPDAAQCVMNDKYMMVRAVMNAN